MSGFVMFVLLVIVGYSCVKSSSMIMKVLGVVVLCFAFNPLSISLTGRSIPDNVKAIWHTGEKGYNSALKGGKEVREKAIEKIKD